RARSKNRSTLSAETRRTSLLFRELGILLVVIYFSWIGLLTTVLQVSLGSLVLAFASEGVISPISYGRFFTPFLLAKIFGGYSIMGCYWLAGFLLLRKNRGRPGETGISIATSLVIAA